ncbi:MAG: hypothetical protein BACD_02603 [Bacteroides rodentium]
MAQNHESTELQRLAQQISDDTRSNETPSAIVACTRSINLALFRYSAIGYSAKTDNDPGETVLQTIAPELPVHLQTHFTMELPADAKARYAVRAIRAGYVYFFAQRKTHTQHNGWLLDGYVQYSNIGVINVLKHHEFLGNAPKTRLYNSQLDLVTVYDPKDIEEYRVLFTPDSLTDKRIRDILDNKDGLRDLIQPIDISAILKTPDAPLTDVIARDQLETTVAELISLKNWQEPAKDVEYPESLSLEEARVLVRQLGQSANKGLLVLQDQYFSYPRIDVQPQKRWYGLSNMLQGNSDDPAASTAQGVGIVLVDPIGITQELNHWRNAGWNDFKINYLMRRVPGPTKRQMVANEHKVNVANVLLDVQEKYRVYQKYAAVSDKWKTYINNKDHLLLSLNVYRNRQSIIDSPEMIGHLIDGGSSVSEVLAMQRHEINAIEKAARATETAWPEFDAAMKAAFDEAAEENASGPSDTDATPDFNSTYGNLLDTAAMRQTREEYEARWGEAGAVAQKRVSPHLSWLTGTELLNALAFYDRDDEYNGLLFASQIGYCVVGMGANKRGFEIVNEWLTDRDIFQEDANIIARAVTMNQIKVIDTVQELMGITLRQEENFLINDAQTSKAVELAEMFSKLYALSEERMGHHHARTQVGMYVVINFLQTSAINTAGPRAIDRGMHHILRTFLIGTVANEVWHIQRWDHAGREIAALLRSPYADIERNISDAMERTSHTRSEFARVRLAGFLVTLQGVNLAMQLKTLAEQGKAQHYLNTFGALFSTAAACSELCATFIEAALSDLRDMDHSLASYKQGVQASSGRFKLWGAGLGTVGAALSLGADIVTDGPELLKAWRKGRWPLATAYGVKLTATGLLLIGGVDTVAGRTISAYFARLATKGATEAAEKALAIAATRAAAARAVTYRAIGGAAAFILTDGTAALILSAASFGIPIGIDIYNASQPDPTTLDEWCVKSVFRLSSSDEAPYDKMTDELEKFKAAILNLTHQVPVTLKEIEYPRETQWVAENLSATLIRANEAKEEWERAMEEHQPEIDFNSLPAD